MFLPGCRSDVSENLDLVPAQFRVLVLRRPRFAFIRSLRLRSVGRCCSFKPSVPCGKPVEAVVLSGTEIDVPWGTGLPCHREPKQGVKHEARNEIRAPNLESNIEHRI